MRRVCAVILILCGYSCAEAQVVFQVPNIFAPQQSQVPTTPQVSQKQQRALVVPYMKALTACVINIANNDFSAVKAFRDQRFRQYLEGIVQQCPNQLTELTARHDEVYGPDTANSFVHGAYVDDLARVVLLRMRPKMDERVAAYERVQAEARTREEQAAIQRLDEARAAAAKAEADQRAAEAEKQAVEAKAASDKRQRLEVAQRAMGVLRDKFYECADKELPGLVKSGEGAEVLASVAITICQRPLRDLQDSAFEKYEIEEGSKLGGIAEEAARDKVKSLVHERVVADAVQAKAGVGIFAIGR